MTRLHNLFKWNNSLQAKQLETIDDFPQSCLNGSAARVGSTSLCRTSSTPVVTVETTIKLHHRNHSSAITFNLPALLPRLSSRIREHPWRHLPGYVNVKRFNFNPFFFADMEIIPEGRIFRLAHDDELPSILKVLEKHLPYALKVSWWLW